MIHRDEVSETLWKWRYKIKHLGKSGDKTLSDFSSAETAVDDEKAGSKGAKGGELGSSLVVKTFYEGPNSRDKHYDWVDYPPKQLSKSAAKAQDRVAIRVFKVKDTDKPCIAGRYSLRYHQVEVQNPLLVAAVAEVLQKQDIHLDVNENATFHHPFQELYFAYDDIVAKYRALEDDKEANPVQPFLLLFIKLLDDMFADTRAKLRHLRENGLVSFKLAWAFFPKHTTVISWPNNCEILCKVEDASYKEVSMSTKVLCVTGKVLRFTGRTFQWEEQELCIPPFGGNRPITELPVYPLEYFTGKDDVVLKLTARGKKVLDYQGLTYVNYRGIALHTEGKDIQKHNVDSRVLIDVIGYKRHHLAKGAREENDPNMKKNQIVAGDPSTYDDDDTATKASQLRTTGGTTNPSNPVQEKGGSSLKRLGDAAQERNRTTMLAREAEQPHLMYMFPIIEGYALKNKLWVSFFVEDISPLVWNDQAYDHLVYDEQQKDLVMSFVENHGAAAAKRKQSKMLEDVIAGKGKFPASHILTLFTWLTQDHRRGLDHAP